MGKASAYALRAEPTRRTEPAILGEEGDGGEFDNEELARLNDALDEAEADYQRGEFVPAEFVLKELRGHASGR